MSDAPKKTQSHARRHAKKYAAASVLATAIMVLQLAGALTPLVCSMPFISDKAACLKSGQAAKDAAQDLGALDSIKLDDGSPLPLVPEGPHTADQGGDL